MLVKRTRSPAKCDVFIIKDVDVCIDARIQSSDVLDSEWCYDLWYECGSLQIPPKDDLKLEGQYLAAIEKIFGVIEDSGWELEPYDYM